MVLATPSRTSGPVQQVIQRPQPHRAERPGGLPGSQQNNAAVLYGVKDLRFENFPLPTALKPASVRIKVDSLGVCGSDVHYWQKGGIGDFILRDPMVIGHEVAGTVVAAGSEVSSLREGDRVALEPGVPCCWAHGPARDGRYNLEEGLTFFATPPVHGALSEFVDHPAAFCYRLPENLTSEDGALIEPLSVGLHAVRRGGVAPGKTVAIVGAGPIGLATLMSAAAFGSTHIVVADVRPDNLTLAKQLGAQETLLLDPAMPAREAAELLKGHFPARGPDVVLDCAGFELSLQTSVHAVAPGGRVVAVGMGSDDANLPVAQIIIKELDVLGTFRYVNTYPLAISLMASGKIDAKPLITHRFGFSAGEVQSGFETARDAAKNGAIKCMFNLS